MNDVLVHRGPDGADVHIEPGLGLAHRRLSIIDLAGGRQPMFNEDGTVAVVFNGEIYNFRDLVSELTALGHRFRTRCDTEVIVHAWEAWGEACVNRFQGMFAFAVWDQSRQTLFLARDRVGIKPLFYAWLPDGHLVFASELKGILIHPHVSTNLSPPAVADYFAYGYVPDPSTIFRDVQKLAPGHTLTVRRGLPPQQPREYWDLPFAPAWTLTEDEAAEQLRERLRRAVQSHLMSDVPLGAFLSGGVDSSSVVAMMATVSETHVNTCSIAFDEPGFDESPYAEAVARTFHTRHFSRQVKVDDYGLIDVLGRVYDEPFADSSAIPTYRVCELARAHVTVALSGDGGDEALGGYRRYGSQLREERLRSIAPLDVRRMVLGPATRAYATAIGSKLLPGQGTIRALSGDAIDGYFQHVAWLGRQQERLFTESFRRELQGYSPVEVLRRHDKRGPHDSPLSRVQYLDFKTYLPGDILTKVDRASMAHSLEVRVPLLDHEFLEWAVRLPVNFKMRGTEGKWVLKRAMQTHLPSDLLFRPKMGFAVPLERWFRGELKDQLREALDNRDLNESEIVDVGTFGRLLGEHHAGRADHSAALWALLMFDRFQRVRSGALSGT